MDGMKCLSEELISEYARAEKISPKEARRRVDVLIDTISSVLLRIGVINLRRFGVFSVRARKNARYKNNYTGMVESIPIIKVISFKPSEVIKRELNSNVKKKMYERIRSRDGME